MSTSCKRQILYITVLGTLDSSVTECIEVLGRSMVESNLSKEISEEELVKGIAQLTARFVKKMEPISCKLEVKSSLS